MIDWAKYAGLTAFFLTVLVCSFLWAISYQPVPCRGPMAQNNNCSAEKERSHAAGQTQNADLLPPAITLVPAPKSEEETRRDERQRFEKSANERGLTVATWVVAFATALLFGAVAVQAYLFVRQLGIMRDTLDKAETRDKILYRAYVSGGGIAVKTIITKDGVSREVLAFRLDVNNYGQTPGELFEYGIGFCKFSEVKNLSQTPVYKWHFFRDIIQPGVGSRPTRFIEIPKEYPDPVIYGRFGYRDVWGDWHSEGFFQHGAISIVAPSSAYIDADPAWYGPPEAGGRHYETE
jgi:hypothetical protein